MGRLKNFTPNDRGFLELATSPGMRDVLKQVAERGKTIAIGLSQDFRVTGDYADSFEVVETTVIWEGEYPGPRAAAELVNTSGHAVAVEYGYRGTSADKTEKSAHRIFGRTLEQLGAE